MRIFKFTLMLLLLRGLLALPLFLQGIFVGPHSRVSDSEGTTGVLNS
jgi:hypothetical protein